MPRVPVEPVSVDDAHVFSCFDALLAHLNGHAPPAVSFSDATWCAQTCAQTCRLALLAAQLTDSLVPNPPP